MLHISQSEQTAVQQVVKAGEVFGFGNMIAHLQTAWAKMLIDKYGMDEESARLASSSEGYPLPRSGVVDGKNRNLKGRTMKYRKKPVVVEAFKWTGDIPQEDDPEWIIEAIRDERVCLVFKGTEHVRLNIETLEGVASARPGDYVIRGIHGEIYPCKPDIFLATYEEA